jgi:fimbrial chaperone protein
MARFAVVASAGAAFLAVLLTCFAGLARADFSIVPISVLLTPQKSTDLITIHNRGSKPVRLQLTGYVWDETPDGKMKLTPTDEVVFYPPLVTVDGNEDRIIRVGATAPFGFVEKTYRLIAQELPPPPEPLPPGAEKAVMTKVIVLTNVSVPVFMEAPGTVHSDSIVGAELRNGRVSFQVKNDGNTHITIGTPTVQGFGAGDKRVYAAGNITRGNYVLAGEAALYEVDIPTKQCSEIHKLVIQAPIGKPTGEYNSTGELLRAELSVTPDKCGPSTAAASAPTRP